jgi:uncharacterized membrane protein
MRRASPYLLAGLLVGSGVLHFVATRAYARIVPQALPRPETLVRLSGLAELACGAGLVSPQARRVAGWSSAALLVAVFPGNVQMAVDSAGRPGWYRALTYARLPLQVPLVLWARSVARGAPRKAR